MGPGQPWQVLPALPAWQVTQLSRPLPHHGNGNPDSGLPDDGTALRAQELVSAHCRSAPIAVAWIRTRSAQRVTVTDPRITLWAELAVLGHLTGWAMPAPGPGALAVHVTDAMRHAATEGNWHTAIEQAIGPRASADDWDQQLTDALGAFRDLRWPRTYLRSALPETGKPAP